MMDRRTFLGAAACGICIVSLAVRSQPAARIYRMGMLAPTANPGTDRLNAMSLVLEALRELGYTQGENLLVERRFAEGDVGRLPALARELVQLRMDVVVAIGGASIRAAMDATTTIPIVFYGNFDPVAAGFVTNLARPGGNVTGVLIAPEGTLAGKKLALLKEAVPGATRIAYLAQDDANSTSRLQVEEIRKASASLGVELVVVEARGRDYQRAFAAIAALRPQALFVEASSYFMRDRAPIIALAAKHRLPAMYEWREQVEDGGLMAYGSSLSGTTRRVAAYVDRIFKGAKPSELPVEQPSKLDLVINLKTAKALGLAIPQSLLLRADEVIQ